MNWASRDIQQPWSAPQSNAALAWSEKRVSVPNEHSMLQCCEDTAPISSLTNPPTSQASHPSAHNFQPSTAEDLRAWSAPYRCIQKMQSSQETFEGEKAWGKTVWYKPLIVHHREIFAFPVFPAPSELTFSSWNLLLQLDLKSKLHSTCLLWQRRGVWTVDIIKSAGEASLKGKASRRHKDKLALLTCSLLFWDLVWLVVVGYFSGLDELFSPFNFVACFTNKQYHKVMTTRKLQHHINLAGLCCYTGKLLLLVSPTGVHRVE